MDKRITSYINDNNQVIYERIIEYKNSNNELVYEKQIIKKSHGLKYWVYKVYPVANVRELCSYGFCCNFYHKDVTYLDTLSRITFKSIIDCELYTHEVNDLIKYKNHTIVKRVVLKKDIVGFFSYNIYKVVSYNIGKNEYYTKSYIYFTNLKSIKTYIDNKTNKLNNDGNRNENC